MSVLLTSLLSLTRTIKMYPDFATCTLGSGKNYSHLRTTAFSPYTKKDERSEVSNPCPEKKND